MARQLASSASNYFSSTSVPISAYPFTLAIHFRPTSDSTSTDLFGFSRHSTNGVAFYIEAGMSAANNPVRAVAYTDSSSFVLDATINGAVLNQWHTAVAVFTSATDRKIYLDGTAGTTGTTSATVTIGNLTRVFAGQLLRLTAPSTAAAADLAYGAAWSVAFTADDVAAYAARLHPTLIRPSALLRAWDFDDEAAGDARGWTGHDLTLNGTAARVDGPRIILPRGRAMVSLATAAPPPSGGRRRIIVSSFV